MLCCSVVEPSMELVFEFFKKNPSVIHDGDFVDKNIIAFRVGKQEICIGPSAC